MHHLRYSRRGPLEAERYSSPLEVEVALIKVDARTVRKRGGSIEVVGRERLQGGVHYSATILTSELHRVLLYSCQRVANSFL